jgi:DNA-binding NarL/FixJ family response regulator
VKVRVLLVDDDELYLEAASAILAQDERLDIVASALDGREAVAAAITSQPDVVLTDLLMPVMDGVEATRQILRYLPAARVVVVTSSGSPDDRRRACEAGAYAFLPKTLTSEVLVETALAAALAVAPEAVG